MRGTVGFRFRERRSVPQDRCRDVQVGDVDSQIHLTWIAAQDPRLLYGANGHEQAEQRAATRSEPCSSRTSRQPCDRSPATPALGRSNIAYLIVDGRDPSGWWSARAEATAAVLDVMADIASG